MRKSYLYSSSRLLKVIDKFTYLDSNISPTESDVNMCLAMFWTAIDRSSILWRFDLSNM